MKAFVVTVGGAIASAELAAELQQLVRTRLAPYEVPREIEFVDGRVRVPLDRPGLGIEIDQAVLERLRVR